MGSGELIVSMLLTIVSFILPVVKDLALTVERNERTIFLLSFVVAGFGSLMMWLAYRRIRTEKWVLYFAITFGILSATFLALLLTGLAATVNLFSANTITFINLTLQVLLSILSNVFGVAAALEIQNRKPLLPRRDSDPAAISAVTRWDNLLPPLCWALSVLSVPSIFVNYYLRADPLSYPWLRALIDSPLYVFSALCVFLMGYAIVANLGSRHFSVLARVALFIALTYAVLQVVFGLSPLLSYQLGIEIRLLRATMILIALPLKFFLCLFAYLLVVRFFEILSELGKLPEVEFDKRQDYLSSEGVVQWIGRKMGDKSLKNGAPEVPDGLTPPETGFVNLVIRLPGQSEKIACIVWPDYDNDKRPKVMDWLPDEKRYFPLSTDIPPYRKQLWEWEKTLLAYVHDVLNDKGSSEIKVRGQSQNADGHAVKNRAVVTMAIQVNGAAIGCLQIARAESLFSQMAIRQIRQIANALASAVQAHRELAGLDLLSITFAKRQSDESTCSPEQATQFIVDSLHDIFAPKVTRLHMDFGFTPPQTIYRAEREVGRSREKIEKAILRKDWQELEPTDVFPDLPWEYKLLKKKLTAKVTPTFSDKLRYTPDKFILGNLLFAVDARQDEYHQPALGVNYLHRKTASTIAADAYLDFMRDYFGGLLKKLGSELSGRRLDFEEWFEPIQRILRKDAGFTWVVVRQRGRRKCFGDEEGLRVLNEIKNIKRQVKTRILKPGESSQIMKQYTLHSHHGETKHILKLRLSDSQGFIWLGVRRLEFGPELDFASPWKTFLVHLAQIADASLSRITIPQRFKDHVEAAQLQGIIANLASTGTMVHQLSNMIAGQLHSIQTLRNGIALGELKTEESSYEALLDAMKNSAENMVQIFQSFNSLTVTDDHSPCRLLDAAHHACKLFEVSLITQGIKPKVEISEDLYIGVSFNVAALALATLVGNSKDAVRDGGMIKIKAWQQGDTVLCQVGDDGPGIPPEVRDRIFDPKTKTKKYGTGFGLWLTSHSLSENRSSIELTRSDESGSVFTIRFPSASKEMVA